MNIPDLMLIAGAGWLAYGAWLIYAPAGYMLLGMLLLAGGLARGRAEAMHGGKKP